MKASTCSRLVERALETTGHPAVVAVRHDEVIALGALMHRPVDSVETAVSRAIADLAGGADASAGGVSTPFDELTDVAVAYAEAAAAMRHAYAGSARAFSRVRLAEHLVA